MHLGLWQMFSTTIQALALTIVFLPTSYGHNYFTILLQKSNALPRRVSLLKIFVLHQTILKNQLLYLLLSVLVTTTGATVAKATAAV